MFTHIRLRSTRSLLIAWGLTLCLTSLSLQATANSSFKKETNGHTVYFTVSESERIENDVASVTFHTIVQAPNADLVMQEINKKMQAARLALKGFSDLELQTSQYQVNPSYNKNQVITHWQGLQSLTIRTENQAGLPKLLETVQPYLSYQSMRFYVSDKTQQHTKKQLLNKALKNYQVKAKQIANSFGAQQYQLIETRIDAPNLTTHYANNYLRSSSANIMSDSVAPVIETGKSEVHVNITGKIVLPH